VAAILAINHEGYFVARKLNDFGYDVAILLYHVSAGKETRELAIADARAALALLQKRGGEFGLSTKKIGVMGRLECRTDSRNDRANTLRSSTAT
jgi:acetyl esterase/lipase